MQPTAIAERVENGVQLDAILDSLGDRGGLHESPRATNSALTLVLFKAGKAVDKTIVWRKKKKKKSETADLPANSAAQFVDDEEDADADEDEDEDEA